MVSPGEFQTLVFEYNFDEDAGAIGTFNLRAPQADGRVNKLQEGFVITNMSLHVQTAVTSGGTPTITFGTAADSDGYLADVFALVGSDNAMVSRGAVAGALLWDDTNDHELHHRVSSSELELVMEVATAALTAGKIKLIVMGYQSY